MKKSQASLLFNVIVGIVLILISIIIFSLINARLAKGVENRLYEQYNLDVGTSYAGAFAKMGIEEFETFSQVVIFMIRSDEDFFRNPKSRRYYETYRGDFTRETQEEDFGRRVHRDSILFYYPKTDIVLQNIFFLYIDSAVRDWKEHCEVIMSRQVHPYCAFMEVLN